MHDKDAQVTKELDNRNDKYRNLKIWMSSEEIQKYETSPFLYLNVNLQTDWEQAV